jgi:hypothetical protein
MCVKVAKHKLLYIRLQKKTKFYYSYAAYAKILFRIVGFLRCNCIAENSIRGENII